MVSIIVSVINESTPKVGISSGISERIYQGKWSSLNEFRPHQDGPRQTVIYLPLQLRRLISFCLFYWFIFNLSVLSCLSNFFSVSLAFTSFNSQQDRLDGDQARW
uniref:Uncharacterized protein n=1 Tax=Spongospora subterranea TaxID=70186 RepID=A0A0H5QTG9_9EUKA|eukprot:CRZ04856.1 hypothetical protein [Spongospora subterranea]